MNRLRESFTTVAATVIEGWNELRAQRTRVLMSLIGVGLAVAAITGAVAAGSIAEQSIREGEERGSGRAASLSVNAYDDMGSSDPVLLAERLEPLIERFGIDYHSRRVYGEPIALESPAGLLRTESAAVDPAWGAMRRIPVEHGRWFTERDERMLAPAVLVDEIAWENLGSPALGEHPTVRIQGERSATAEIVGVVASQNSSREWSAGTVYLLVDDYLELAPPLDPMTSSVETYLWVPEGEAEALADAIRAELQAQYPVTVSVQVERNDPAAWGGGAATGLLWLQLGLVGVASIVLLLAALSLVNITMVTVRHRVREIGIRRAFGATGRRVFVGVVMESVVGTAFAGVIGVAIAVLALQNPWVRELIGDGIVEPPPFPIGAAVVGLLVAVGVGALAGVLPALVAVRVRVIEAIRF